LKQVREIHYEHDKIFIKGKNMNQSFNDYAKEELIADLNVVVADAEALLKATAGQGGEALAAVRAKVEASLGIAKAKLSEAQTALLAKTRAAAKATDEYVHVHPWQAIGVGTAVGVLVGLLIARR
jgi:ElaB/YqjD/DUF883 family membrane-anchored ribosome-binding protein